MNETFFSVIVVSLNAEATIRATIDSILDQGCRDFEIIVKDGGSADGTLVQIPDDSRIRVIQKADTSIYDAMNQAIEYAQGKFLLFLNCGDTLADANVLADVKAFAEKRNLAGREVMYGDCIIRGKLLPQPVELDRKHFIKEGLCHQSVFFGKALLNCSRGYDLAFKICADYELLVHLFITGAKFYHVGRPICIYQGGGISERRENLGRVRREGDRVRRRYFTFRERVYYNMKRIRRRIARLAHC